MQTDPPTVPTATRHVPAHAGEPSPPALRYEPASTAPGWPAGTRAVVAAAAVVSVCSLGTWGGSLWMFVQPSAFPNSRLMLTGPLSFDFARFVLHAVAHAAVIAGALLAPANQRLARRLVLAGACGALALAVFRFASFSMFQTGLSRPRQGPDQIVAVAIDGARLVGMNLVHGLLVMVLVLTRAGTTRGTAPGIDAGPEWPPLVRLIVAAAAVNAATNLMENGATGWISLQPHLFNSIRSADWTSSSLALFGARAALYLAVLGGGAAALLGHARGKARGLLVGAAAGLLALSVYGYVHSVFWPPLGMPRYQEAQRVTTTVYGVASLVTLGMIHVLVILALTRWWANRRGSSS
jgi:hypothetical protein